MPIDPKAGIRGREDCQGERHETRAETWLDGLCCASPSSPEPRYWTGIFHARAGRARRAAGAFGLAEYPAEEPAPDRGDRDAVRAARAELEAAITERR